MPADRRGRAARRGRRASIQHEGSGADQSRQAGPHAHSINLDAGEPVRGRGRPRARQAPGLPASTRPRGRSTPNDPPFARVAAGLGPAAFRVPPRRPARLRDQRDGLDRHRLRLRPRPRHARRDRRRSRPSPRGHRPGNSTAEVQVHPSGRFLYGSNRGHDTIAIFAIDAGPGELRPVGLPADRRQDARGTSASTRPAGTCWPPTRTRAPSSSSGSTRRPAGSKPTGQTVAGARSRSA